MVKLARAYLKLLPSNLPFDPGMAQKYYEQAIEISNDPHAQYGIVEMMLGGVYKMKESSMLEMFQKVIYLLEESAKGGNVFAMFNLGVAHLYGYSGKQDPLLAKEWFEASNLPEGYIAVSITMKVKMILQMPKNIKILLRKWDMV